MRLEPSRASEHDVPIRAPSDNGGSRWLGVPISAWDALGIATAFVLVQSRFMFLPRIYDPIEYFFISSRLEDAAAFHRSLRIGLTVPVRLIQEVFGYSEAAYYFFPLIAATGLAVSVYFLGQNLFSRSVGLLSAAVVMVSPVVLSESAQLYPDMPSAAAFTGGISLIVASGVRYRATSRIEGRMIVMLVCSGLLFGWAYLTREFIVILFPVALLVVFLYRMPMRVLLYVGGAALIMFGLELAWGWWRFDQPLARLGEVLAHGDEPSALNIERIGRLPASTDSALEKLSTLPRILGLNVRGTLLMLLGGFGIISALLTRDRGLVGLAVWTLLYWSLLMIAYIWVDSYGFPVLRATLVRYWYPILPALIVGGFGGVHVVLMRAGVTDKARTLLLGGIGAVLLTMGVLAVLPLTRSGTFPGEFHQFRNWLAAEGTDVEVIWTDQRTGWLLLLYTNSTFGEKIWSGQVMPFNTARRFRPPEDVSGGLMVYFDTFFRMPLSGWRGVVPEGFVDPVAEWVPAFVSHGSTIVAYEYDGRTLTQPIATISGDPFTWSIDDATTRLGPGNTASFESTGSDVLEVTIAANQNPTMSASVATPGYGAIRVTLDLEVDPNVWIEFECAFSIDTRHLTNVRGTTLYHPANESESVEYVCGVPDVQSDTLRVAPRLLVSGEGSVSLGDGSVDWFETDH